VQDAEHGRVGAEPERERQDDGGRELRRPAERSHRIYEVLSQAVHTPLLLLGQPWSRRRVLDGKTAVKVVGQVEQIRNLYKDRFGQESVLRVDNPFVVWVSF
jgi:hypothetical protein